MHGPRRGGVKISSRKGIRRQATAVGRETRPGRGGKAEEKGWRVSWSVAVVLADWQVSGCCLPGVAMIGLPCSRGRTTAMEDVDDASSEFI